MFQYWYSNFSFWKSLLAVFLSFWRFFTQNGGHRRKGLRWTVQLRMHFFILVCTLRWPIHTANILEFLGPNRTDRDHALVLCLYKSGIKGQITRVGSSTSTGSSGSERSPTYKHKRAVWKIYHFKDSISRTI